MSERPHIHEECGRITRKECRIPKMKDVGYIKEKYNNSMIILGKKIVFDKLTVLPDTSGSVVKYFL